MVSYHFCFIKVNIYRKPLNGIKTVWEVELYVIHFLFASLDETTGFCNGHMFPL